MKIFVFTLLTLGLLILNLNSYGTELNDSLFNIYKIKNDNESRLIDYKDSDDMLKLKILQLAVINKSRAKHRVQTVELDILASRVANKMSKEAALNGYLSHWNMKGEKPYHRYAFAGGYDHVAENAAAKWSSESFQVSNENIFKFMQESHKAFMNEKAPRDGHKQNCINKHHNFVGIGVYLINKNFRYYEEFIDRYYIFKDVPDKVNVNQEFSFKVETEKDKYLVYCVAYREKFPKSKIPIGLSLKGGYKDYSSKKAVKINPWEIAKLRNGNQYTLSFKFKKSGLYYIHIYQFKKEYTKPASFTTGGKAQGSGIVIKVVD